MSKLLFGIGEKIIFSSMAVASKGIYDVSIKHTNSVDFGNDYLIISFSVFLFGVYLIQMSKKLKENKHGSS
jgi:large-conductance mechanosensitive channel